MAADFRAAAGQARADGFGALRVAAEMGDFAEAIGSVDRLLDWERLCTPVQREEATPGWLSTDWSLPHWSRPPSARLGLVPDPAPPGAVKS
jgi:hypothetical protein